MAVRNIVRNPTALGFASSTACPIYCDSDDNRIKFIPAGTGTTEVILQEAGGASTYERLITTRVLTAADSGKTFGLALVGGFTVTLPALSTVSGFNVNFVVEVAPTTAYIVITNAADLDTMAGQVYGADGVSSGAGSVTTFSADQMNFVASASVIGDQGTMQQVGTTGWAGQGFTALGATGMTFTG